MRFVLVPLLLLSAAPAFAAGHHVVYRHCAYEAQRTLDIDPANLAALRLELTSGDLRVEGVAGLTKIEVRGRACAAQAQWLDELNLTQNRVGDKVVVATTPREMHFTGLGENYAYIDVAVRVPAKLPLEVDTHSGDSEIAHVAALDFTAHSGDLNLADVAGAVSLQIHSGDVEVKDVGALNLRSAGSGDVTAHGVHGEVKVGRVGSGDLRLSDVQGGVQVESIGSGDFSAERVGGDVTVGSIGSGNVAAHHVGGGLTVRSAGSGNIRYGDVKGQVQVPKRHERD